jgi:uncharacterized membrane protein YbhN (UPF0104 family)
VRASARNTLRWLGGLLSVAGIGYVVWRFSSTSAVSRLFHDGVPAALLVHVLAGVAIYTCGLVLLALAWWWLISAFATPSAPVAPVTAAYATSQFAKYLPGNVGQYLARHALLRRLQLPHGALVAAAGLEAASLVVAALAWAVPAAGAFLGAILHVSAWWVLCALVVVLILGLLTLLVLVMRSRLGEWIPLRRPARLAGVLAAHVGFFGVMVLSLVVVAAAMPDVDVSAWRLTGVATSSWLAGFLVIGSPGGLGVREAVFVELLKGAVPEPTALLLAAAFRVVTLLGDLTFLLLGFLVFS